MAVNGIGNSYSYPVQSNYATETKTQDTKNAGTQAVGKNAGVNYEKTISDSTSVGLEFMKQMEKENSGTKFFVGTVSYGQTYGNSTDTNFVVNPKFLSKLGADEEAQKRFEEDVKYLHNFAKRMREQAKASGREIISQGWFCDENGNWGGWTVSRPIKQPTVLQDMTDNANKIREEKLAEKKEKRLQEEKKAEKELREHFGDRFKGISITSKNESAIKAINNKITIKDPYIEAFNKYGKIERIDPDGTIQWDLTGVDIEKMDKEIGKFISREDFNFWHRLAGDPTFLSLDYSTEEVRNRLAAAGVKPGFFTVEVGMASATQFLSQGKYAAAVYSKEQYDRHYEYITSDRYFRDFEVGHKVTIGGEEYTLGEDKKLDIPYGADIYDVQHGDGN